MTEAVINKGTDPKYVGVFFWVWVFQWVFQWGNVHQNEIMQVFFVYKGLRRTLHDMYLFAQRALCVL